MHRQLTKILEFLDSFQPTDPQRSNTISHLRERARHDPNPQALEELARAVDSTRFQLKTGARLLPGLAMHIRECVRQQ